MLHDFYVVFFFLCHCLYKSRMNQRAIESHSFHNVTLRARKVRIHPCFFFIILTVRRDSNFLITPSDGWKTDVFHFSDQKINPIYSFQPRFLFSPIHQKPQENGLAVWSASGCCCNVVEFFHGTFVSAGFALSSTASCYSSPEKPTEKGRFLPLCLSREVCVSTLTSDDR